MGFMKFGTTAIDLKIGRLAGFKVRVAGLNINLAKFFTSLFLYSLHLVNWANEVWHVKVAHLGSCCNSLSLLVKCCSIFYTWE
jgi:hypothetical protein